MIQRDRERRFGWKTVEVNVRRWRCRVRLLDRCLEAVYRSPRHGNPVNPLDDLFFILISNKTAPERYLPVFKQIKSRFRPWKKLLGANVKEVAAILEPLGLSVQRARQILAIAEKLQRDFGRVSLATLKTLTREEAHVYLLTVPGVGDKSARCVMMYTLGHDTSPMDTHAIRVASRFGLLPPGASAVVAHRVFDERLPKGMAYRLHVNLVAHGRAVCRSQRPLCEECVLRRSCPSASRVGTARAGDEEEA